MPAADAGNLKLGNVNYLYGPPENCADSCPFKGNGCYAENFRLGMVWKKITQGLSKRSATWEQLISKVRAIPKGDKVRLWVAGDFPRWHKGVDTSKATELGNALHGKKAWAYTHHHPRKNERGGWAGLIRHYLERSFTINISCERPEHVDEYMSQGLPCVIAVPSSTDPRKQWRTAGATEFGSARTRSTRKFSAIDACSATSAQLTWPSPSSRTEPRKKTSMLPWLRRHHPYLPLPFARHGTHNTTP